MERQTANLLSGKVLKEPDTCTSREEGVWISKYRSVSEVAAFRSAGTIVGTEVCISLLDSGCVQVSFMNLTDASTGLLV
jgi:hypothetical protein